MTKKYEWRPTAEPWVIDRGFSIFVKNRCVFFHARTQKYRKIFNLASKFVAPNRIVVLYVYGAAPKTQTLKKRLEAVKHQMLVICVPVTEDDLSAWDAAEALRKRLKQGGISEEHLQEDAEQWAKAAVIDDRFREAADERQADLDILRRGKAAFECLQADQRGSAWMFSNFTDDKAISETHNAELLELIRDLYPCGVEANAPTEQGAKMLMIKRLVQAAIAGAVTDAVLQCAGDVNADQMTFFADNAGAVRLVNDISEWCASELRKDGCFSVPALMQWLAAPPYGFYDCNYYAYLRAKAMVPFAVFPYLLFSGVSAFSFGTDASAAQWLRSPHGIVFHEGEKQKEMSLALRDVFPQERLRSGQNGLQREISFAREWIQDHDIQTPLDCVDRRWGTMLRADDVRWCSRTFSERFYDFLMDKEARIQDVGKVFTLLYTYPYPEEKLKLFYKFYHIKGGSIGWLWTKESFEERLEEYMSCMCCRECGKPFQAKWKDGAVETCQADDLSVLRFTQKDIVGLNKKLLGRYQEEYFCVRCLSEILDTTPQALHEKIHTFKEQGCELFI